VITQVPQAHRVWLRCHEPKVSQFCGYMISGRPARSIQLPARADLHAL